MLAKLSVTDENLQSSTKHLNCSLCVCVSAGTGSIVAIMIPEPKGREIMALLEQHIVITLHITIGTRNLQKYVSRTSVVFVSISFIILMIISLAWLVFYYIQRFRYANARNRNQVRPGLTTASTHSVRPCVCFVFLIVWFIFFSHLLPVRFYGRSYPDSWLNRNRASR